MFTALGVLLCLYTLYGLIAGEIYVKSGAWGKQVSRADSPQAYWTAIVIYTALAIALMTVF